MKVYEIWNEPNCWSANPAPGVYTGCTYLYPSNYGWMLARSWEAVHIAHQLNDVTLFFGGVFGHNIGGVASYANAGAQYIDDTYSTGTNVAKGQSFNYIRTNYNAFPLDGIGEHLYLSQGGLVASNTFRQYEDWVHQACTKYEGADTPKRTFITEFGWTTASVSQGVQETNLITAFSVIQATPYVQMAIWFQWADNPAGNLYYGVTNNSSGPKLAFPDYERFERFEGISAGGATNAAIQNYFYARGAPVLGDPYDNGSGPYVHPLSGGYAQDYAGGSHGKLMILTGTNGTFEVNDLHGLCTFYQTNNGPAAFGFPLDNEYVSGSGTRQDFWLGYLTWDTVNHIVWHQPPPAPTGLSAVAANAQVALEWNACAGATGYNVKRARVTGGPYGTVGSVGVATNYLDAAVTNGATYYYVVSATNSGGEGAVSAEVSALPVAPPVFTVQPQSLVANQGQPAVFSVTATSAVPVVYQWRFNGGDLAGATAPSYALLAVQPTNAGSYAAVAANYGGSATSAPALLTVRPLLAFDPAGVLSWSGSYALQSASNVGGPYTDVPNAASPYTNSPGLPRQFFRLRN